MQQWDYRVEIVPFGLVDGIKHIPEIFNKFGEEGWELVALTKSLNDRVYAFFKRPRSVMEK